MDGSVSDEQANLWLEEIAVGLPPAHPGEGPTGSWISLHFDNPSLGGVERAEISGGGYVRYRMIWSPPRGRSIWSTIDARFAGLLQTKVVYFGVWDLQYQGFLRAYAELPEPGIILNGNGYTLHAGQLAVSFG